MIDMSLCYHHGIRVPDLEAAMEEVGVWLVRLGQRSPADGYGAFTYVQPRVVSSSSSCGAAFVRCSSVGSAAARWADPLSGSARERSN